MQTKDIVLIALFTAIIAALGILPPFLLPVLGVPITAQSIGPMLAGTLLGAKRGSLVLLLFCVLLLLGFPLLAGGRGGAIVFYAPTGGFVLSWILAAALIGTAYQWIQPQKIFWELIILFLGGVVVVYLCGFAWFSWMTQTPFQKNLWGSWVLLPGDVMKLALVIMVRRVLTRSGVLTILANQKHDQ